MKKWMMIPALLVLAACSKLDLEHYNQIKMGMTYQEISAIMGDASSCDEVMGARNCVWESGERMVKVAFMADKAIAFSHKGLK